MKKKHFIFTILLLLALAACQPAPAETPTPTSTTILTPTIELSPTITNTITPRPTRTSTLTLTPTITQTLVNTYTPVPTSTITQTPTITLTPSITPTASITPTPYISPELYPEDKIASFAAQYYLTNGGCTLPCWWGITPGKTKLHAAADIMVSLGASPPYNTYPNKPEYEYTPSFRFFGSSLNFDHVSVGFFTPTDPLDPKYNIVTHIFVENYYAQPYDEYVLADYLKWLGEPDQITIEVNRDLVFFNVIFTDKGISITTQEIVNELSSKSEFKMCPQSPIKNYWLLGLWDPNTGLSETRLNTFPYYQGTFVPLEEYADITMQEFYQIYLDPDTSYCIEGEVVIDSDN